MPVGRHPSIDGISDKGGEKREDPEKGPPTADDPVDPEDRVGADVKDPFRRIVILGEDEALRLRERLQRPRQDLARRLSSERREPEMAAGIDLDDVAHRAVAERTLSVEKNNMFIHWF